MNETVRPVHRRAKSLIRSGRRTPTRSTRRPTQLTARAYEPAPSPRRAEGHRGRLAVRRIHAAVDPPSPSNLFVLTGPPGSGKTAILDLLRGEARCVDQPAREILAEQRASRGTATWDQDRSRFVDLLLRRSIEKYRSAQGSGGPALFDRGIPDCIVYAIRAGADPGPSIQAAANFRYESRVLFLDAWKDIYSTDEERLMSFEDTMSFGEALRDVYERSGYDLVPVPKGPIRERAAFLREFIAPSR